MSERVTVELDPGFVLHQRPYRNTSQLIEFFSADHGRVGLVARGSRRPKGGQRASLQPFRDLRVSWIRRGELGNLTHVEADEPPGILSGRALMSAYYANELMLRLTIRDDPNHDAYVCYANCLSDLYAGQSLQRTLRLFEFGLLAALGYALQLNFDTITQEPIDPDSLYAFDAETGPRIASVDIQSAFKGSHLIALRERSLDSEASLHAARRLLTYVLDRHLGGRSLRTRDVLRDMTEKGLAG